MIHLDRRRLAGMAEAAAWLLGRRRRVRVVGESMVPTLHPGQFVLVDPGRRPQPGQLVVAHHPERPELLVVKRVASIGDDGRYELSSDNPEAGTDSRAWGPVPAEALAGTVTMLLDRPSQPL